MLTKAGLYYPYIHFRDDAWMKLAALYWPAMARIVPAGYPTRDSATVQALRDNLDFIRDLRPGAAAERTGNLFMQLLQEHGSRLTQSLAVQQAEEDPRAPGWSGGAQRRSELGYIYAEKMSERLRDKLIDLGLAVSRPEHDSGLRRHSMHSDSDPSKWIGVDERLANIYMCVLADELSRQNSLSPVTDQPLAHVAAGGWSVEDVANILLGSRFVVREAETQRRSTNHTSLVAYLALDLAFPDDIANVPIAKIVAFRTAHADELYAFQSAVGIVVGELEELGANVDETILNQYAKEAVARHFAHPRRELEKALRAMRFDTALTTLSVQTSLPAFTAGGTLGVTVSPAIGVAAGVAVGIASIGARTRKDREILRRQKAAADYLLRLERELRPSGAIERSLRAVLRR